MCHARLRRAALTEESHWWGKLGVRSGTYGGGGADVGGVLRVGVHTQG
jgi:hypothetical protein